MRKTNVHISLINQAMITTPEQDHITTATPPCVKGISFY